VEVDPLDWFGFDSVRPLPQTFPDIRLVSLPGHSAGHAGVAVPEEDGWLLHCGDAYFDVREMDVEQPQCSLGFKLLQRLIADDNSERLRTQERLRSLKEKENNVQLLCSHSRMELDQFSQANPF
jgi:glyoxylase-like metal-dependent hydrolase (beta-lactamase superfamily II)